MQEQPKQIATVFDNELQHVGQVYAKALIGAAQNAGKLELVVDELSSFVSDVLNANPAIELAMSNPKMSIDDKSSFLDRVFGGKMDPLLLTFLKVVCRRQRLGAVRAIQQSASDQRDEIAGRIQVAATVPGPLDAQAEAALISKLQTTFGRQVRLTTKVDPSILGGLIIRIGDTVYDGSVDGQLRLLRKNVAVRAEDSVRQKSADLVAVS